MVCVLGINSKKAYNKIISIKNRPVTKPFPIMYANEEQIKSIAIVDEIEKECPKLDGMMEGTVVFGEESTIIDCTL